MSRDSSHSAARAAHAFLHGGFQSCGGVAVRPGDAILADDSGVLVLPREVLLDL